ncbi:PREDICTED: uncharacterized protein C19orf44 homolog isoform X2 [Chinchilla lanigera]|uniref:uncharacterized protein C19orf44 homolog isoform X2 n=1 Tax=Chinchilla lanigera TaxID=34839 RepID=UPI00038EC688|nr:PREDICTED: uncharacterized protein C19orf44 homolog isoform X2 [Chinchilla lanigera]
MQWRPPPRLPGQQDPEYWAAIHSGMASMRETSFPGHRVFDLSAVSLDELQMEDLGHLASHRHPTHAAPMAGRFLKRDRSVGAKHLGATAPGGQGRGPRLSSGRSPTSTLAGNTLAATGSQVRAHAVLRKAAQMESKTLGRAKACLTRGDMESDPKTVSERPPEKSEDVACESTASPLAFQTRALAASEVESPVPGRDGRRFLKTKAPAAEDRVPQVQVRTQTQRPKTPWQSEPAGKLSSLDSDAEEMHAVLGSLAEFSGEETCSRLGLPSGKVREREPGRTASEQTRTPQIRPGVKPPWTRSPPASGSAHRALQGARTHVHSPQACVSRGPASCTASLSVSGTSAQPVSSTAVPGQLSSSSRRSAAGAGEDAAPDTGNQEDDDSLDDFRVNILSLDDLAPAVSENSDLGQKAAGAQGEESSDRNLVAQAPAPAGLEAPRCPQPRSSACQGAASPGAGDKGVPTESESESEVSERLGDSVRSRLGSLALESSSASTAYSEDFEPTPSPSEDAPEGMQETASSSTGAALLPRPPASRQPRARPMARVTLRDTAVQTLDVASARPWAEADGVALGGSCVDPAPIAPHVVSAEAIEALTAHSPATVALDDLLRQQLHLTQQFIQASRHLHVSLLRSLDGDAFHYHSLEEAKEYIRRHRPSLLSRADAVPDAEEP